MGKKKMQFFANKKSSSGPMTRGNEHNFLFFQDSGEKPETMSGKDAAMFPIIASCTLFGIYLIFQVRPKLNLSQFMTFTCWNLSHQGSH